jgi:prepilin-type N-terminal cleavage/methylation domain-containing protein
MKRIRVGTGDATERDARRDAGFSLVEMVVTVTLMGLAMIPILIAALSLIKTSSYNRNATKVETVLANAADRVNRAKESCNAESYQGVVNAAAQAQQWGVDRVQAQFSYYEPEPTPHWTDGLCAPNTLAKDSVQMVRITVTSPDGKVHRSMQVVKSKI